MENKKKLFLLDGYALIYRAYFAFIKNPRINSRGLNTSAVLGFTNSLLEVINKEQPSHIAVALDTKHPTERHEEYSEYKANRESMPEGLKESLPYIFKLLEAFNIPALTKKGYEADDIIGTLAKKAEGQGFQVFMMTSDKDFAQLVSENIFMYRPATKWQETSIWGVKEVLEKFKIKNINQVIDFLAMMGDSADNIPGIPGVGKKTAQKFIEEYGSLEGLLENSGKVKGKLRQKVESSKDLAILCKKLVTINTSVPISCSIEEMKYKKINSEKIKSLFDELEFRTLLKRILAHKINPPEIILKEKRTKNESSQISLFSVETEKKQLIQNIKYNYIESENELQSIINQINEEGVFSIYILSENDDLFSGLKGYSLGLQSGEAYYINSSPKNNIMLKDIFENNKIEKIAYDIKYVAKKLQSINIRLEGKLFDISLAHYLLYPEQRHSLEFLSDQYLNINLKSDSLDSIDKDSNKFLDKITQYCCGYVDVIFQLSYIFNNELEVRNIKSLFHDIEVPLTLVLAQMEWNGIMLDSNYLFEYEQDLSFNLEKLISEIYQLAGETFNIASPKQIGEVLFDKMKLSKKPKKTKSGQYSTSEETLLKLKGSHDIIDSILEFRGINKLLTTYVKALPKLVNPVTTKIHTTFNQSVASTGRLSSTNPNLQNIPIRTKRGMRVREAFISRDKNYTILSADYSQIELRIMAALSKDKEMTQAFHEGVDIHTATAAKVYKVALDDVNKEMRTNAKSVNFGIIYGISPFGLSQNIGVSRSEAKEMIDQYFKQFPGIKSYMDNVIIQAREFEYVETFFSRRRYLPNINSKNAVIRSVAERNAINMPIQGTAADIIKKAMITIHNEIIEKNMKSKMLLQVHDELIFDMHHSEREKLMFLVKRSMEQVVELEVPLIVDMGEGKNWLQAH